MQRTFFLMTWAILSIVIFAAALGGSQPLLVQSPGVAFALGMIGLGLCKHAHEQHQRLAAKSHAVHAAQVAHAVESRQSTR